MIVGAFGKEISEVFIQYAAQLALNRVELANVTNTVLKGVLSSENFGILTLDLSDTTWSVAGGGTPPPIVGKEKIITKIMNGIEELHTLDGDANPTAFKEAMTRYWGDSTNAIFDRINFSILDSNPFYLSSGRAASLGKAALFVGGGGDDLIHETSGRDFIWGGVGHDTVNYQYSSGNSDMVIYWNADGSIAVKDPNGSMDILENVETILGKIGSMNSLELIGSGDFVEVSDGTYNFNGHTLTIENLSKIIGDSGNQNMTLLSFPSQGVDGGAGTDRLSYSIASGIYNQISDQYYLGKDHAPINATGFEALVVTGQAATQIVDTNVTHTLSKFGQNDFSTAGSDGVFNVASSLNIHLVPYLGGYYSFEKKIAASAEINGVFQYGEGYLKSGSGFGSSWLMSALDSYSLVGGANYRGTDFGDTVTLRSAPVVGAVINFVSGYGNDDVSVWGSLPAAKDSGTYLTYTSGHDVLHLNGELTSLNMWADIRPSDVSISGNVITIADHGSITVDGTYSISDLDIVFLGGEKSASIDGSWRAENWTGKEGRDETFYGLGGDDVLNGGGGQDKLFGGEGNDTLYSLSVGTAFLNGGVGNDTYHVSINALTTVSDQSGNNTVYATDFNRVDMRYAFSADGNLILEDHNGNAVLTVESGTDVTGIVFQNGETVSLADLYADAQGNSATYETGNGQDLISINTINSGANVVIDLKAGNDSFLSIAVDPIVVYGGEGNDFIYTDKGDDQIYGGVGDDYALCGEEGNDYIDGGDGRDTYALGNYTGSGVHGGHVDLSAGIAYDDGTGGVDTLVSIENVDGTRFDDLIIGDDGDNTFAGNGGNDTLYGMGGNDTFWTESSYHGSLFIDGGDGIDTVTFISDGGQGVVANLQAGTYTNDGKGDSGTILNIENLYGSLHGGDDIIGSDKANTIYLLGGGTVRGGDGDDILSGSIVSSLPGSVTLYGENGNDKLIGSNKNDILIGGAGNDVLEGGEGDDTYIFAAGDGIDIIRDTQGTNILQVEGNISLSDLVVSRVGNNLVIHIASGVTIENYFMASPEDRSFYINFSDHSSVNMTDLEINNQAPVAQADDFILDQNTTLSGNILADNGHGIDYDPDGDTVHISASILKTDNGGTFNLQEDGRFTYSPADGFVGVDLVTYSIHDGFEGVSEGTAYFVVAAVASNSAPEAHDDLYIGDGIHSVIGNVLANDIDVDEDILTVTNAGEFRTEAGGVVSLSEDGHFIYSSVLGYLGEDHFSYSVSDNQGGDSSAVVALSLEAPDNSIFGTKSGNILFSGHGASTLYGFDGNDLLFGNNGNDQIFGGTENDFLNGNNGNDLLVGSDGRDIIFGGNGNDILVGGDVIMMTHEDGSRQFVSAMMNDSNDILFGGNGDDILIGGGGRDLLFGDGGADTFMFLEGDGEADRVMGFNTLEGDKVDISALLEGYDPVSEAIADFVQVTQFRGQTTISVDVDGGGDNFVEIVSLIGTHKDDLDAMISKGSLVV